MRLSKNLNFMPVNTTTYKDAQSAISLIKSGDRVFLQGSAATPVRLIKELIQQKERLQNDEIVSITLQGFEFKEEDLKGHFFINSLFVSQGVRKIVNSGSGDYVPIFLSEIPILFRQQILPLDVAIVQVSPP